MSVNCTVIFNRVSIAKLKYIILPGALPPPPAGYVDTPTYQGQVHNEDVKDDPNLQPTAPTAPPMEKMDQITGYDGVTFGGGGLAPPPSYDDAMRQPPPEARPPLSRLVLPSWHF